MEVLKEFGITINKVTPLRFEIQGGQKYIAKDYKVEGDFSQLAFFAVLGALNNDLKCTGVKYNSKQGDKAIIDTLKKSGVKIEEIEEGYLIYKGKAKGCEIDLGDCPCLLYTSDAADDTAVV